MADRVALSPVQITDLSEMITGEKGTEIIFTAINLLLSDSPQALVQVAV